MLSTENPALPKSPHRSPHLLVDVGPIVGIVHIGLHRMVCLKPGCVHEVVSVHFQLKPVEG